MDTQDETLGRELLEMAAEEAWRSERKFSRYVKGNIVHSINSSAGEVVEVDDETSGLIDFADRCHQLSGGLFDITSGVLRKAWKFDGSDRLPREEDVARLIPLVGWDKVEWKRPSIRLRPGMEIDLGGIGKEYAVDRTLRILRARTSIGLLINYGGDIATDGERAGGMPWVVGIEQPGQDDLAVRVLHIAQGALATSGDSKRYLRAGGKRYGHILNPKNGWPAVDAPRSVTVAAGTCTEAGFLSTYGILNGKNASSVLDEIGVRHWCH